MDPRLRWATWLVLSGAMAACGGSAPPELPTRSGRCGDGVVAPGEGCDDGGVAPGDGCSSACQVEAGWRCSGSPSACGAAGEGGWTWMAGSSLWGLPASGEKGVPSPDATPWSSVGTGATWVDAEGRLWLFGGFANRLGGPNGYLADLWMFDGSAWTWVEGPGTLGAAGVYGTRGVAAAENWPGGRSGAASWTDAAGNFWLFGGGGHDASGAVGNLNDLWRFDGRWWTWEGGAQHRFDAGSTGVKGVSAPTNLPEARLAATAWVAGGAAWLFGGQGYRGGTYGEFGDLWRFDGQAWTWISGAAGYDDPGSHGVQGVAAAGNSPPARFGASGWVDGAGALWLFGGYSDSIGGGFGDRNDLWRFDGQAWTWMAGSSGFGAATVHGVPGVPGDANTPGARRECVSWTGPAGELWLFAGGGYAGDGNELWRWAGGRWTFVGGAAVPFQAGVYGARGVPAVTNQPGARSAAAGWSDGRGAFWVFGGIGVGTEPVYGALDDLWRFVPPP